MKFPHWFYPHSSLVKPIKPTEPSKQIKELVEVDYISTFNETAFTEDNKNKVLKLLKETERVHIAAASFDDGTIDEVKLVFSNYKLVDNVNYKQQLDYYNVSIKRYEKELKLYNIRKPEWDKLKILWDEKEKEKELIQKQKKLKNLTAELAKLEKELTKTN
jgi:hypothetical protein